MKDDDIDAGLGFLMILMTAMNMINKNGQGSKK